MKLYSILGTFGYYTGSLYHSPDMRLQGYYGEGVPADTGLVLIIIIFITIREAVKKKRWKFPSLGGVYPIPSFFSFFVYVLNHPEMQRKIFFWGTPPLSGSLGLRIFPKLGLRIENS